MKLSIERAALLRSLNHVQSVVERRNTIPILSNVLMKAEDGVLSLCSTDMDLEVYNQMLAVQHSMAFSQYFPPATVSATN